MISRGSTGTVSLLPTVGSSISPGLTSGAVTMKITSSTSITSMYGTTLIWLIGLRYLRMLGLPLQDVRELLDERLVAHRQAVDVVRIAVVGDDGRNGSEESDRRRDQRFGNARSDVGKRRLGHVGQPAKRVHDAPHRAEEPDVRRHGAYGREPGEIRFQRIDLALIGGAHRAARGIQRDVRLAALPPVLRVFAESRGEDVLQPSANARLARALEQLGEIAAFPELVLERIGLPRCALQLEP